MPRILDIREGNDGEGKENTRDANTNSNIEKSQESLDKQRIYDYTNEVPQQPPVQLSLKQIEDDDEERDRDNYTKLPYLQSSLFGTILEDTVTQLRILVECNNELRIKKTKSDWPKLMGSKYGVIEPVGVDELDGIDTTRLDSDEYKIKKLDTDRKYITEAVIQTYLELCLNKSFNVLQNHIDDILNLDFYRANLAEEEAKCKIVRRELYKQLRQQRNYYKTVVYDTNVRIENLKTEVEDFVLVSETKNRYIDNWQNARTEQHIQTIDNKEGVHTNAVEHYKQRTDHEQRVHMEIEMLINIHINETLQQIESWMDKYDADIEEIDLKIHIKKNAYQDMLTKRINLEETIVRHKRQIQEWIAFKDERAKARAYHDKMSQSAIIVQAWWRGLLVRLQMGPFKVAKRKVVAAGAAAAALLRKMGK